MAQSIWGPFEETPPAPPSNNQVEHKIRQALARAETDGDTEAASVLKSRLEAHVFGPRLIEARSEADAYAKGAKAARAAGDAEAEKVNLARMREVQDEAGRIEAAGPRYGQGIAPALTSAGGGTLRLARRVLDPQRVALP